MSFEVRGFRAADYETPLWAFANLASGRFNRAGVGPATQYVSLHPMTPWAEVIRNLDVRSPDDARQMRMPLWALRVKLDDAPYELTYDSVSDFALEPADLVADDRTACRSIAAALHAEGIPAFTAPSAALPGTRNLVVLRPAVVVDFDVEPVSPEDWPTALAARDGRCPEGLWDVVHFKRSATPHSELDAWERGDLDRVFEQPLVDAAALHR